MSPLKLLCWRCKVPTENEKKTTATTTTTNDDDFQNSILERKEIMIEAMCEIGRTKFCKLANFIWNGTI